MQECLVLHSVYLHEQRLIVNHLKLPVFIKIVVHNMKSPWIECKQLEDIRMSICLSSSVNAISEY